MHKDVQPPQAASGERKPRFSLAACAGRDRESAPRLN